MIALAAIMLLLGGAIPAWAQPVGNTYPVGLTLAGRIGAAVSEASHRFGVPESWIRSVMRAESAEHANAVSRAGAIGLMQVMPQTYAELSIRLGLGSDPFEPHDNILAGAAYLRQMFDRYGTTGMLAAYNAGPERYEEHLVGGRPLPEETADYLARFGPLLDAAASTEGEIASPALPQSPADASPIFIALSRGPAPGAASAERESIAALNAVNAMLVPVTNELFPSRSGPDRLPLMKASADVEPAGAPLSKPPARQSDSSPSSPNSPLFVPRTAVGRDL